MNICVFGDSIVWGAFDPINGGWVTLLRNYLEKKYDEVTTYNLGKCGDNSSGLLKRFRQEATSRKPDLIILAIGANDVVHLKDKSFWFEKYQSNMVKLISQAKKYTNKIIILAITPVEKKLTTIGRDNRDIIECNKVLEKIAKKEKLVFVPISKDFSTEDLFDGLHPNTRGHVKIFEMVKAAVMGFLSPE
ncbi:MAG TPA: SGNH/GDSL hydrolase family protein [Candidatus Woesebacteria bacterium]|mgnify:CR=1 FL=1|nr:SGNH/GDSL hydrolase family protein [Candidatus Woesebacteria bacterium]HPR99454.1 SGNH/GDSL hydrolase family protein [Candidatus Woesebacteria bacterium]